MESIQLLNEPAAEALLVKADRDLLQQACLNLIVNAMDAVRSQQQVPRQIRLAAEPHAGRLAIRVRDTGLGVGKEEAKNLFKLFYSSKRGGTGLGLPIAQRIVESHGGSIIWKNLPEGGAEFTIVL